MRSSASQLRSLGHVEVAVGLGQVSVEILALAGLLLLLDVPRYAE
jgi:hypothetical protein